MLTLFSVPKPFTGDSAALQARALASWVSLGQGVQVVLLGDEEGVAANAAAHGVDHVGGLARSERGTPRLDSAFSLLERVARHPLRCFVNADVILFEDLLAAAQRARGFSAGFLLVGRTRELAAVEDAELRDPARLARRALRDGRLRGAAALDYFVFPAGLYDDLPPFLVGRACFDNWLVWTARQAGPVIDATRAVVAIHQEHGYAHLGGGKAEAYYGDEAEANERLAGGRRHLYTLHDADYRMRPDGSIARNLAAVWRIRETARRSRAKLALAARRARDAAAVQRVP